MEDLPAWSLDYLVYILAPVYLRGAGDPHGNRARWVDWLAWLACDVAFTRKVVDENLERTGARRAERRSLARGECAPSRAACAGSRVLPRKITRRVATACPLAERAPLMRAFLTIARGAGHQPFQQFRGGGLLGLLGFPTRTRCGPSTTGMNDFLERFRGATDQHLIPKGATTRFWRFSAVAARWRFWRTRRPPQGVGDFFGRPASTYKAIALLALEHDALIAVCYARQLDRPMRFEMVVSRSSTRAHEGRWRRSKTWPNGTRRGSRRRFGSIGQWWVHRRGRTPAAGTPAAEGGRLA